jgi:hypothetical protein
LLNQNPALAQFRRDYVALQFAARGKKLKRLKSLTEGNVYAVTAASVVRSTKPDGLLVKAGN